MRAIKFRGVDMETGETVYGELGTIFTTCTGDKYYFGSEHSVKPESVKQLIGVDGNGCEVYEGDKVVRIKEWQDDEVLDFHGYVEVAAFPMMARFDDYRAIADGEIVKVGAKG